MTTTDASLVLFNSDVRQLRSTLNGLSMQSEIRHLRVLLNDTDELKKRVVMECLEGFPQEHLVIVDRGKNVGFAAGHNLLVGDAFAGGANHCLIINPDLELTEGALGKLLLVSGDTGNRAIVSGVLLLARRTSSESDSDLRVDSRGIVWTDNARHLDEDHGKPLSAMQLGGGVRKVFGITGALMLVPRFAWSRIRELSGEFFDEDFFAYREDAELGLRAAMLGVDMFVLDEVVGTHARGTQGTNRDNGTANRLSVRNRFLIASKYGILGRPGKPIPTLMRDLLILSAVVLKEKDSFTGLTQAWRLRASMAEKKRRLDEAAGELRHDSGRRSP